MDSTRPCLAGAIGSHKRTTRAPMAAASHSQPGASVPESEGTTEDGTGTAEGLGFQSEKAKAKADAKAKAKAEKDAKKAANVCSAASHGVLYGGICTFAEDYCGLSFQAAARGQKQAAPTQPDENDPLKEQYGDTQLVQSQTTTGRKWTRVEALNKDLENEQVHSGLLNCANYACIRLYFLYAWH